MRCILFRYFIHSFTHSFAYRVSLSVCKWASKWLSQSVSQRFGLCQRCSYALYAGRAEYSVHSAQFSVILAPCQRIVVANRRPPEQKLNSVSTNDDG